MMLSRDHSITNDTNTKHSEILSKEHSKGGGFNLTHIFILNFFVRNFEGMLEFVQLVGTKFQ